MNQQFKLLRDQFRNELGDAEHNHDDIDRLYHEISEKVRTYLTSAGITTRDGNHTVANDISLESLGGDIQQNVDGGIGALFDEIQIPQDMRETAADTVALVLGRHFANGPKSTFSDQMVRAEDLGSTETPTMLDSYLSPEFADRICTDGDAIFTEAYGANISEGVADVQMSLTVALMRMHLGMMPRVVPTRTTDGPSIVYTIPVVSAIDLSDSDSKRIPFLNLYENPTMLANDLPEVVPYDANDDGTYVYNNEDGWLKPDVKAPLKTLGVDASTPGFDKANHTDIIAEGARIASVRVKLTISGDSGSPREFDIPLPEDRSRLVRMAQSQSVSDRALVLNGMNFVLGPGGISTESGASTMSPLFTDAETGIGSNPFLEGLRVTLMGTIILNRETGMIGGSVSASVASYRKDGEDLSTAWQTVVGSDDSNLSSAVAVAYAPSCQWSEQNLRRSSIHIRTDRRNMVFHLPIGRHYLNDRALTQDQGEDMASALSKAVSLGEDYTAYRIMHNNLTNVANRLQAIENGADDTRLEDIYVAGNKVHPFVYQDTLDLTSITSIRDADRQGDIASRFISYMNSVTTRLQAGSRMMEQLRPGTVGVYRVPTSFQVLSGLIGQPVIHSHLSQMGGYVNNGDGVEYRITLPNGVVLEVVTSNFEDLSNTMYLIPHLQEDPESELNYGHIWDMGTIVGSMTFNAYGSANKRMYANARQLLIVTNPVAAVIDIVGLYAASETELSGLSLNEEGS